LDGHPGSFSPPAPVHRASLLPTNVPTFARRCG
jgi:hypothetical protein